MIKSILNFAKQIHSIVCNYTNIILRLSIVFMLSVTVITFTVQYKTAVLEREQDRNRNRINRKKNEIKILTSEYVSLISPFKLKKMCNEYLPSFKEIKYSDKVSVIQFR